MREVKDIKKDYPISLRMGIVGALFVHIMIFLLFPEEIEIAPLKVKKVQEFVGEEIPAELEEMVKPPPKEKLALPEAAESEAEVEAGTIAPTEFPEIYRKPEESVEIPVIPFWKVEVKPTPKHQVKPKYPELARKAEIEGTVVVHALVDVDGKIIDVEVIKSSGSAELDKAAVSAAREWLFNPGKQRDRYVRVWVAIPFHFRLTD